MHATKYLLISILCLAMQYGWAQDEKPYFEGEIMRTRMVNGKGGEYRGKHIERYVYTNGNRHIYDTRLGFHSIQLYDQNRCIIYYDGQDRGVEYPLDKLFNIGISDAAWGKSNAYTFEKTDETKVILDYECDVYKATKEVQQNFKTQSLNKNSVIEYYFAVCPKWKTDSIWFKFADNENFPVEGMIIKQVRDEQVKGKSGLFRLNGNFYQSERVTKIEEREVDDKEFEIPESIKVQKFRTYYSASALLGELEAANRKALKKEKRYPTQLPDNETFDTDDEWED